MNPAPVRLDILRLPLLGRLLKQKRGRLYFQIPLLLVALLLLYDGFTGPQQASQNLATVGVWVHYRGVLILILLLVGNLFCMGCPFTLPRTVARRLSKQGRRFPKALRGKWLAFAGLFGIFFLYEWLDLWASPLLTAWVILAYFGVSFALELIFTESAFCKYVCPLGTFNFVYSTVSPLQISTRSPDVCRTCVGKECLNGSYAPSPLILTDLIREGASPSTHEHNPQGVLGCGTLLFVPQIRSNFECTLCLDCARACPHDNVALQVRSPAKELLDPQSFPRRWDVSFLFIALAFMGVTNAFGMIPPVYDLIGALSRLTGINAEWALLLILFGVGNVLLPALVGVGMAWAVLRVTGTVLRGRRLRNVFCAFAPAFILVGIGIWAAHYGFHFVTGALTIVPVFQNFLQDHQIGLLGPPNWALGGLMGTAQFGLIQGMLIVGGYGLSLFTVRHTAADLFGQKGWRAWLVVSLILLGLVLAALYVNAQPMEMRGISDLH